MKSNDVHSVSPLLADRQIRDLGALQTSELFLLNVIRLWCGPGADVACRRALVRNGFQAAGLAATEYEDFRRIMETIAITAPRPLAFGRVCAALPTDDEIWLLECMALILHRRSGEAFALLNRLLPAAAARITIEDLKDFVAAFASAGLYLRARSVAANDVHAMPASWRRAAVH